jgi:hypothetical protein
MQWMSTPVTYFGSGSAGSSRQRAERLAVAAGGRGARLLDQRRQLALDRVEHHVPEQFLADALHRGVGPEHRDARTISSRISCRSVGARPSRRANAGLTSA